jgi:hypothetical protein
MTSTKVWIASADDPKISRELPGLLGPVIMRITDMPESSYDYFCFKRTS